MRPLLVGLAPRGDEGLIAPLTSGAVGTRLAGLCGIPVKQIEELFETRYIFKEPLPDGRVSDWARAKSLASVVQRSFLSRRVVLIGDDVRKAYGIRPSSYKLLHWFEVGPAWVAVCPHLSGRSTWWTQSGNIYLAHEFFGALVMEAKR